MKQLSRIRTAYILGVLLCLAGQPSLALAQAPNPKGQPVARNTAGLAEARLIEVYGLIGKGKINEAINRAGQLVQDVPNFQLAQLVYGDLLSSRIRPVKTLGDISSGLDHAATGTLNELRDESRRRILALKESPAPGLIPSQFLALSPISKHAIAVDASRSRLYLFENTPAGLKLVSDFYISVGKAGTAKVAEGDQKTPLGIYYITSNLDPKSLKDFYGSGALPINYPNVLDAKRGKTGSGIWLHGTPSDQFARLPQSTDGCVVLANPDLEHIIKTVSVRTTPVVIAPQLEWVEPKRVLAESKAFESTLSAWKNAKSAGNVEQLLEFYSPDFNTNGKNLSQWTPVLKSEIARIKGRAIQLKDVSYLRWTDNNDTMIVSLGEVPEGAKTGSSKRQYWSRTGDRWKIFYEGNL